MFKSEAKFNYPTVKVRNVSRRVSAVDMLKPLFWIIKVS